MSVSLLALALGLLCYGTTVESVAVTLEEKSNFYIPAEDSASGPVYKLDAGVAEQMAYDERTRLLYVVGYQYLHVLCLGRDLTLQIIAKRFFKDFDLTNIQVCKGQVIVSAHNEIDSDNGQVWIFKRYNRYRDELRLLNSITVGNLPDFVGTTKNCRRILVALEGEPYEDTSGAIQNPEGYIGLIKYRSSDLSRQYTYKKIDFAAFDSRVAELQQQGLIYGDKTKPLRFDLEPEYICLTPDEKFAYVTLQENNAVALIDVCKEEVLDIFGLGFKDHSLPENKLDASDKDSGMNIKNWPVSGAYQPDAIACFNSGGKNYFATANEGDLRDSDEARVKDLTLDPSIFCTKNIKANGKRALEALIQRYCLHGIPTDADELQKDENLGRLKVNTAIGDPDGDGSYSALYSAGSRGVTLWGSNGELISDTGDEFETLLAVTAPEIFNANLEETETLAETVDSRSDDKGLETEAIASTTICKGRYELFIIGNEKPGTLILATVDRANITKGFKIHGMYDGIRNKTTSYTYEELFDMKMAYMLGPEGLEIIRICRGYCDQLLLLVAGSDSSTVTVFEMNVDCDG